MRVKMVYPCDFSFILHYSVLDKFLSLESWHSHLHWLSLHRDLYILFIRLSPTQAQWTCCWLKASGFAPATGWWWLLAPSVLVFRSWCSCGGDENNCSSGVDNAEIDSRPINSQPCWDSAGNTSGGFILALKPLSASRLQHLLLRTGSGWASWGDSQDKPVRLWLCVNAKGILLLRYAVQRCFQCCLAGCLL